MKLLLLSIDNLEKLMQKLAQTGDVFFPGLIDDRVHYLKRKTDRNPEPVLTGIRTAENLKPCFFPCRDVVSRFPRDVDRRFSSMQYLFGVKACDIRGFEVYDRVFEEWQPTDQNYHEVRSHTVVIASDCPAPEKSCFCNFVGLQPYAKQGYDINVTKLTAGYLFEVATPAGESVIDLAGELFRPAEGTDFLGEREGIRQRASERLAQLSPAVLDEMIGPRVEDAPVQKIREGRDECVECFACLHACPTCYCFLLSDVRSGRDIERLRVWDACYYAAYARVGGGANPRSRIDDRFWNRFNCKFNYFPQYEKFFACSGCGRCLCGCSASIDIRKILTRL